MRWSAAFGSIVLGLTCVGCGSSTREAAAEEQVTRAIDELAGSRPASAEVRLLTAIRLDPSSARAGALLHLMRGEAGLSLEFYDVTDFVPDSSRNLDADDLVELIEGKLGEDEGGSVEYSSGILIVRKSLAGHEEVVHLLDALRRTAGVMVTVESRFVPDDELIYIGGELIR